MALLGPGAVYLLPHAVQSRFKVGWSLRPMRRLEQLPEFERKLLDLAAAQVAWFPQAHRARQAERVLHRGLAPYSVWPGHGGDGCTEWFDVEGLVLARRMLGMLPIGRGASGPAALVPFLEAPSQPQDSIQREWAPPLESAIDAWYRVEDLWSRLLKVIPVGVEKDGVARVLRWRGLRRLESPARLLLRSKALDIESYGWWDEGHRRSIVRLMDWEGDDLLVELTASSQLRRWCEGEAVDDRLRGFMARCAAPGGNDCRPRRKIAPPR